MNHPTNVDAVKAKNEAEQRRTRFARVLSLTDRILSTKVTGVTVATSGGPAPAWTDGAHITLNASALPKLDSTSRNLAVWLGANYHELGHVMYSPRTTSPLRSRVVRATQTFEAGAQNAWNLLEDQRQERLMIAQFSPLRAYFTAMASTLIVESAVESGNIGDAHVLLVGRTWLPSSIRDAARAAFTAEHGNDATVEIDRIVSAFQRLSDSGYTQADEAMKLIIDFCAVTGPDVPDTGCDWTDNGNAGDDDAAETDDVDTPDDETHAGTPDEDDDDGEGDPADGDDEGEGGGDAAGNDSDGDSDDTDEETTTDSGTGSSDSGTAGDDTVDDTVGGNVGDVLDALSEALDEMLNDDDVSKDLDDVVDALDESMGEGADGRRAYTVSRNPTPEQGIEARRVEDAMRDILDAAEPRHLRGVDSGKLNVRRYATSERFDADTMFDRFEAGREDAVSVEVVVLLDRSGSMGGQRLVAASGAVWAVQRGVEAAEGDCTVLAYDTQHSIIQNKGERAPSLVQVAQSGGGTNPSTALKQAYRILSESDAANRILISVTDGQWRSGEDTIEALNQSGVVTAMVLIDEYDYADGADPGRKAQALKFGRNSHTHVIGSVRGTDIAPMFRSIAEDLLGRALR